MPGEGPIRPRLFIMTVLYGQLMRVPTVCSIVTFYEGTRMFRVIYQGNIQTLY
jgi:hypothetical protein